ncbi:MAG: DnaJ domain-containing protein [Deltaproteobacteria bacterium]|nr:DnaJ domain-containing protein [Deltaproteobacteria bacterium]
MREDKDFFKTAILAILEKFPAGISEYNMMQELKGKTGQIPQDFGHNNLALFRSHFLLFNALYELQLKLPEKTGKVLEISPLHIQLRSPSSENSGKLPADNSHASLRDYYLDMANLEQTTSDDVEDMLNQFWKIYFARDKRIEALKVLGLEEGARFDEIRKRYRELAKKIHPDRGGDKEKLQEINEAMEILEGCYKK